MAISVGDWQGGSSTEKKGRDGGMEHTWSLIVVGVEPAGEPGEEGHFDKEDDGVQQRLWVEAFR